MAGMTVATIVSLVACSRMPRLMKQKRDRSPLAHSAQGSRVAFLELDPVTAAETAAHCESATGNLPLWRACDLRDIEATRTAVAELAGETGAVPGAREQCRQ